MGVTGSEWPKWGRNGTSALDTFCNRAPVVWHSKRQNGVETSAFGSDFTAMKIGGELIKPKFIKKMPRFFCWNHLM